jgi:hypothetical protein
MESVRDFNLAAFRPHPPGYPVYVAALRVAAAVVRAPMQACVLVAIASGVTALALTWDAARRAAGERSAWIAAAVVGTAPGVWRACSGVGSEAPALACAAACAWGWAALREQTSASRAGATILGLGAGLGLGVRLSWAPIYVLALAGAPRGARRRAWVTGVVGCAAWALPFVAWVGPARLAGLYVEHARGHAARWGGTTWTEPGAVRLLWLVRDVFVDGLGVGSDVLGLTIGALVAVAAARGLAGWRLARWRGWRAAIVAIVPYLTWIALGQNLRDQPRHALPLVAALAAALALSPAVSRAAFLLTGALALAISMRTASDAHARRTIPPPGEQLVQLARRQPSPDRLAVFGGASVRFFETTELAAHAFVAGSLGDARMQLTRLDELPARVWVTNEVLGPDDSRWQLDPVDTLCRPPRLDRRMPCLAVYAWRWH